MQVLLVAANTERGSLPALPYGAALVAAAVRAAGHGVTLLDLLREQDPRSAIADAVRGMHPDAIGISVRNIDDQCMEHPRFLLEQVADVVATCRQCSTAPVVLGGAGYSLFPAAALTYLGADFGICGEGESALPALLSQLGRGEDVTDLPGVYAADRPHPAARTFVDDLDAWPLPAKDLWPTADPSSPDLWIPIQSRRGCPFQCSYCSTPSLEGHTVRARAPERVTQEIAGLAAAGFRRFYFVDSTFNYPAAYALEMCQALAARRLGIAWRCIIYPHDVPPALVQVMAEAGCVEVGLGFESGAKQILQMMNKQFLAEEVRAISDRFAAAGIRRTGFLLLGGPGETQATVAESLAFAASLRLDQLRITVGLRIYPNTPLAKIALREGIITPQDDLLAPCFYLTPGLTLPAPRSA